MNDALDPSPHVFEVVSFLNATIDLPRNDKFVSRHISGDLFEISFNPRKDYTEGSSKVTDGFYHGKKPEYVNYGHHELNNQKFRGGGAKTELLPDNHEELWSRSIPGYSDKLTKQNIPKTWYSIDDSGIIHQFQVDNNGIAHWAGSENGSRGVVVDSVTRKRLLHYFNEKMK